jgi:2-(1,2-epoxy-1,2-dihydrophenyl)acetyl-CoA isomerase
VTTRVQEGLPAVQLHRDGTVLIVVLDRPERLNALNTVLLTSLRAVAEIASEADVGAVVLTGAGRGFCAGADLRENADGASGGVDIMREHYNPTVEALAGLRKPVIAAVNGPAAGAGLSLACLADIRLASATARFVPAFGAVGVVPDLGATYFIPRIVGYARAAEWLMTGKEVDAGVALGWRLVSAVVAPDQLLDFAVARAHEVAQLPATAIGLTKALLQESAERSLTEQLEAEAVAQAQALKSPERQAARERMVARLRSVDGPNAGGGAQ